MPCSILIIGRYVANFRYHRHLGVDLLRIRLIFALVDSRLTSGLGMMGKLRQLLTAAAPTMRVTFRPDTDVFANSKQQCVESSVHNNPLTGCMRPSDDPSLVLQQFAEISPTHRPRAPNVVITPKLKDSCFSPPHTLHVDVNSGMYVIKHIPARMVGVVVNDEIISTVPAPVCAQRPIPFGHFEGALRKPEPVDLGVNPGNSVAECRPQMRKVAV